MEREYDDPCLCVHNQVINPVPGVGYAGAGWCAPNMHLAMLPARVLHKSHMHRTAYIFNFIRDEVDIFDENGHCTIFGCSLCG